MGLELIVGIRALTDDPEGAAAFDHDLATINQALATAGVAPHVEPRATDRDVFTCQMWGYSGLHDLRRLAAHIAAGNDPAPFLDADKAAKDPLLRALYELHGDEIGSSGVAVIRGGRPAGPFDHLVLHSDAEGMYVPIAFDHVVVGTDDDGHGFEIGSSVALRRECEGIATWLGLPTDLDPESDEVWQSADSPQRDGPRWKQFGVESFGCLRLLVAARRSIDQGMVIVFA